MADAFDRAVETVLAHEGFGTFTDDPDDPGGATRWGISLAFLRGLGAGGDIDGDGFVTRLDVEGLTREQAVDLYRRQFWDLYRYGGLFHGEVAAKVFDLAVNMGPRSAHRCLQRALRAAGLAYVTEDGVLGPQTRHAVNAAGGRALLTALRSEAAGFYRVLAARKPGLAKYIDGWLNRAYD